MPVFSYLVRSIEVLVSRLMRILTVEDVVKFMRFWHPSVFKVFIFFLFPKANQISFLNDIGLEHCPYLSVLKVVSFVFRNMEHPLLTAKRRLEIEPDFPSFTFALN